MYYEKTIMQQLPSNLRALIEAEMDHSERIDWVGQPIPGRFALRSIPTMLFAIPWLAFSLFWIASASNFKIPDFKDDFDLFPLFGVPFVLIGLGMISSPLFMMYKAKRTAYVLTTSRAIIFEGGYTTKIRSFEPSGLNDLRRHQKTDGSGDIIFERKQSHDSDQKITDVGFFAISNVKEIELMVRKLANKNV